MPFVFEGDGDPVFPKSPQGFLEPIIQFLRPFAAQEGLDLVAPTQELGAVAPLTVRRISQRNALGIARVPRVLGSLYLP